MTLQLLTLLISETEGWCNVLFKQERHNIKRFSWFISPQEHLLMPIWSQYSGRTRISLISTSSVSNIFFVCFFLQAYNICLYCGCLIEKIKMARRQTKNILQAFYAGRTSEKENSKLFLIKENGNIHLFQSF